MTSTAPVADLVFDEALYPRRHPDLRHIGSLTRALEGGSKLPPIVVCRSTKKIIDGVHRYHAARHNGQSTIAVEWRDYKDDAERFKDAILLNSAQGLRLGTSDTLKVLARGEDLGFKEVELAGLLRTTLAYVQILKPRYAVVDRAYAAAGGKLQKIPLKGSVRHLAGETISEQQAEAMTAAPGNSYLFIARQLKDAINFNLLPPVDKHPTLWVELAALRDLLNNMLNQRVA